MTFYLRFGVLLIIALLTFPIAIAQTEPTTDPLVKEKDRAFWAFQKARSKACSIIFEHVTAHFFARRSRKPSRRIRTLTTRSGIFAQSWARSRARLA